MLGWRRYRARGLVNPISNLPNLNALRVNRDGRKQALVAARMLNYEEIVATLPPEQRAPADRADRGAPEGRLAAAASSTKATPASSPGSRSRGSRSATISRRSTRCSAIRRALTGLSIDLTIAFGVEVGSGRSLANRLASALVAADEAAHDGLKWKYHDPESLENASWKLSMLSQLDEAIDRGEVWVAYQPKLDLATRRIIGAEALARWTHPEKGPIAASEFVAAAEQHNRIGKLTDFVLEKAVAAAAQINKRGDRLQHGGEPLGAAADRQGLHAAACRRLLARHGLAPEPPDA